MSPAFFLAALFAISAVAQYTGLGAFAADRLIPLLGLGQGGDLRNLYAVTGLSTVLSHLTTAPAGPPRSLQPLAQSIATETGWTIETIAMVQVIGISTPIIPYQAPAFDYRDGLGAYPNGGLVFACVCGWQPRWHLLGCH